MEMIRVLGTATDSKTFMEKIPDALKVVRKYRRRLIEGACMHKNLESFKQKVSQVIAAEQLLREGVEVSAGKNVRFLFTSAKNKRCERRVRAEELIEEKTNPDVEKYLLLLYSAASNILSPFGYSAKDVYDSVRGYKRTKLTLCMPPKRFN